MSTRQERLNTPVEELAEADYLLAFEDAVEMRERALAKHREVHPACWGGCEESYDQEALGWSQRSSALYLKLANLLWRVGVTDAELAQ